MCDFYQEFTYDSCTHVMGYCMWSAIRSIQPKTMVFSDSSDTYPQTGGVVWLVWVESGRGAGEKIRGGHKEKNGCEPKPD